MLVIFPFTCPISTLKIESRFVCFKEFLTILSLPFLKVVLFVLSPSFCLCNAVSKGLRVWRWTVAWKIIFLSFKAFFFHLSFLYIEEIPAQCIWTHQFTFSLSLSFFFSFEIPSLELFALLFQYYCLFSSSCIYVNFNYKMLFCYPFCNLGIWYIYIFYYLRIFLCLVSSLIIEYYCFFQFCDGYFSFVP